jgi:hypothetical protein
VAERDDTVSKACDNSIRTTHSVGVKKSKRLRGGMRQLCSLSIDQQKLEFNFGDSVSRSLSFPNEASSLSASVKKLPSAVDAKPHCGLSAKIFERDEFGCFVDAARENIAVVETRKLRAAKTQNDNFAPRHKTKRLERAGTLVIVFEKEPIDIKRAE